MRNHKLIFGVLIILFIFSCNENNKHSKKESIIENKELQKAKNKRVDITFDRKIKGYEVTITWNPFKEIKNRVIGPAIIRFLKPDQEIPIEIITDYFSIPSHLIEIENNQYKLIDDVKPNDLEMVYVDFKLKEDQTIGQIDMPFFFFDIDFDGTDELIITEYFSDENYATKYKVFKINNGRLEDSAEQITNLEPYNSIYINTKIDVIKKGISNN